MKIAYFTDLFLPKIDGVAVSVANFSRELGERGHQVIIFAPKQQEKLSFKEPNVEVFFLSSISLPAYPDLRLGTGILSKTFEKVKKFNPDIFHFQIPLTIGTQGVILAKILDRPLVGTFHAFLTEKEYLKFIKIKKAVGPLQELFLSFQKFYYGACDVAITPCYSLKKDLLKAGFNKKPIKVIPSGMNLKKAVCLSEKEALKLKEKMGLRHKVVLHFGRLSGEKSVDIVLKSAKLVIEEDHQTSFLIIGDGPILKDLKALVKKLRISDKIKFTGAIQHDKLLSSGILSIADVFVTASKMESQGMVVIEAMATGLPIIGARKAALPEVIGSAGLLVKPDNPQDLAEKTLRVLTDEKLKAEMRKSSLKRAKEFSIEKSTDKLLELYQELIEKRKGNGRSSFLQRF
ncbi:glycosyltransferase [Candidatus Microgenomates bacterium]|nr:glycosyltransferase [Candidatus Microgenomates bacterium]